jgi:hypothetical protein
VKVTTLAVFAAGYVVGARAGRERYVRIVDGVARASQRLEAFSARHPPAGQNPGAGRADSGSRSQEAPV